MTDAILVNFTATQEDSFRVAKFLRNDEFLYRHDVLLTSGIVFVAFVVIILLMADDVGAIRIIGASIFSIIPAILAGAGVFILHRLINPWLTRRTIAKYFEKTPLAGKEAFYVFSADGISVESDLSSTHFKWPSLFMAVETDSDILFYFGPKLSWFIPKSAFANQDDVVSLKLLLQQSLEKRAILLEAK
jgi:hypothetical protein